VDAVWDVTRPASIVVETLGRVWLFAIAGGEWQAPAGPRVARVGSLPVRPAKQYTARYMETDVSEAQGEAVVEPDRGADDRGREPVAWIADGSSGIWLLCQRSPQVDNAVCGGRIVQHERSLEIDLVGHDLSIFDRDLLLFDPCASDLTKRLAGPGDALNDSVLEAFL
jgi:hypothetical protein